MPPFLSLAPLHGVTNRVFRAAWLNHFGGFDEILAPFIFAISHPGEKKNHFRDLLPENNRDLPTGTELVPQLLGNSPEDFVTTGTVLADLGYGEINWNLGCPYARVANKKRGSGLLPHPDLIRRVLEAACSRLPVNVSVKVRLGRYSPAELPLLMPVFNDFPLKKVIIHPRIGTQMYTGEVDLEGFAEAARLCRHPVAYNGDIKTPETFQSLRDRFPFVDEWMIGRWAVTDPFLPGRIKGQPPEREPLKKIKAFHDEFRARYASVLSGPGHLMDKLKELWRYLGPSFPDNHKEILDLARSRNLEEYDRALERIFSVGVWRTEP